MRPPVFWLDADQKIFKTEKMEVKKRFYPKNTKRRRTKFSARPGQIVRLEGKKFGDLTVLSRAGRVGRYISWLCRCSCGAEIEVVGYYLRRGKKTRCADPIHKLNRPKPLCVEYKSEYQSWTSMRERCRNPKHKGFKNYGGRGITICERWNEFKKFMLDMGRKPDPKFTIEREDVNGNYEPTNCRWLSRKDQGRNQRNSVFVTYNGKRMLLIDLVEELGLSRSVVYGRLKMGWTLAQAISLPKGLHVNRGRPRKPRGPYKKKPIAKRHSYVMGLRDVTAEFLADVENAADFKLPTEKDAPA